MLASIAVSHKTASLPTLDSLTLRDLTRFYSELRRVSRVSESVVLQTCNRVELFIEGATNLPMESLLRAWALATKFRPVELQRLAEVRTGEDVVKHLVRVASGLESMIVGEPQIIGQVRDALLTARIHGSAGPILSEVFERASAAAARIRAETGVGKGVTTIGSAALKLAEQTLGRLEGLHVLLLGTGEVGVLLMKALKARGVSNVAVAGRVREKSEAFCRSFGGSPIPFQTAKEKLNSYDLVLVATKSNSFLIDKQSLSKGAAAFSSRMMVLDLSNPRNVSPDVRELQSVILRTIEDLRGIAEEGLASRREIVKKAEPFVQEAVDRISARLRRGNAEPVISEVYHRAEEIRLDEVSKALSKLKLKPEEEAVLEYMSQRIVEKVLNGPVRNLRRAAEKGDAKVLTVAGQLFAGE